MNKKPLAAKILQDAPAKHLSSEAIITGLRGLGFRITKIRQAMIETLVSAPRPMSAPELLELIARGHASVNKTTIYRELDFLSEHKLLSEIDLLDGMKRYEILNPDHHHHHLVCTSCREICCVEVPHNDLHALESTIQLRHNFTIKSHVLEFFGLCNRCN